MEFRNNWRLSTRVAVAASGTLLIAIATVCEAAGDAASILRDSGVKGGLVVHVGCGDGKLTAALRVNDSYLVQGLDADAKNVDAARAHIQSLGKYGPISVDTFDGKRLPYIDNTVNLLVADDLGGVPMAEVMRVLAPQGVAYIGGRKTVKPRPDTIDEWTHYLHGPDNNAVANDAVVGPPAHLQWLAGPRHLRTHEHLNSLSALVSAGGRVFYIIDEGPTAAVFAKPRWRLVARDAFNGVLLWKRDIGPWEGHWRLFRSGPADLARRLVAVGDRVYATPGYGKPVVAFDAATGQTVRTYDATAGALEILHDNGRLYVLVGNIDQQAYARTSKLYHPSPPPRQKGIVTVDADSGRLLWKRSDEHTREAMPTTLAVSGERLFFQNTRQVVCLDAGRGDEQWRADRAVPTTRLSWSAPTLVVHDDVVLSSDGSTGGLPSGEVRRGEDTVKWVLSDRDVRKHPPGDLFAFDAKTGKQLWTGDGLQGFCCPGDVFVIDGLVWAGALVGTGQHTLNVGLDPRTGQVKKRRPAKGPPVGGHTRCYRNKATERFLVLGGIGVEFVDVNSWKWTSDRWVRGTCQYGVMPCNGLLYVPPDSCACRPNARLHGFTAMAPATRQSGSVSSTPQSPRLVKGPAYGSVAGPKSPAAGSTWPTYRNDGARSGATKSRAPNRLQEAWTNTIGGKLTSPTVAAGKVFVARVDANTVYALDAGSGRIVWQRTVGGPVDSPPTIRGGRVVFGCRDGRVYCLRADDGELAWQFTADPTDRRLVAHERVESAWPVHGSVLVRDGLVWFAAGRSSYLDGGIRLCAVELTTGKPRFVRHVDGRDAKAWSGQVASRDVPGTLPDILSTSGDLVFMGWTTFDTQGRLTPNRRPHLFSATGFLDDTWWHRTYWQYGTWMRGGFGGWPQAAQKAPAGRVLALDDRTIFGFGRSKYDPGNPKAVHAGHVGVVKDGYQDIGRIDHSQNPHRLFAAIRPADPSAGKGKPRPVSYRWQRSVPMLVRAMVLADRTLLIAGPAVGTNNSELAALDSAQPGLLWAVSPEDGSQKAACKLTADPVLDGMAVAGGALYVSCRDGTVRCLK